MQIGMQTGGGDVTGCTSSCYVPQENAPAYYDVIKALTDKGVHVIQAAGNGNINLDHAGFNGKFDVKSGIPARSLRARFVQTMAKASFSTYGSRVTSASWGCWDVVTTGYGGLHSIKMRNTPQVSPARPPRTRLSQAWSPACRPLQKRTISPSRLNRCAPFSRNRYTFSCGDSAKVGTHPNMAKAVAGFWNSKRKSRRR